MRKPISYYVNGYIPENIEDSIAFIDETANRLLYIDLLAGEKDLRIPAAFDQEDTDWVYALEPDRKKEFLKYLSCLLNG